MNNKNEQELIVKESKELGTQELLLPFLEKVSVQGRVGKRDGAEGDRQAERRHREPDADELADLRGLNPTPSTTKTKRKSRTEKSNVEQEQLLGALLAHADDEAIDY